MIEVMYAYGYVSLYTYIFIGKSNIMLMNARRYPFPITLSPCLPRSYDVGTTSMPSLLRWYYVLTLSLWWLPFYYVNFEHVQNLTTSLPFLQTLLRSYHAFTTLIPFLVRSSGFHYALAFLESVIRT